MYIGSNTTDRLNEYGIGSEARDRTHPIAHTGTWSHVFHLDWYKCDANDPDRRLWKSECYDSIGTTRVAALNG